MIRLFNHYFHAWTVRRIFFDFLLSLLDAYDLDA